MRAFVLRENAKRYRRLLEREHSETKRAMLRQLLADAEAELAALEHVSYHQGVAVDDALRVFAEATIDNIMRDERAQFGSLHLRNGKDRTAVITAQRNLPVPFLERFGVVDESDGTSYGRCLATGHSVVIPDVFADPAFAPHWELARRTGFRAMHSTPLRNDDGEPIVILTTLFAEERHFTPEQRVATARDADLLGRRFDAWLRAMGY